MKHHPGPVVKPPVNETFMSVFLKHYDLSAFPIFEGFSIPIVIKPPKKTHPFLAKLSTRVPLTLPTQSFTW
jgi:hypothetical protein